MTDATPIPDYNAVVAAVRGRIDELRISHHVLEDIVGLPRGYIGKLLGPSRVKQMSLDSFLEIVEGIGMMPSIAPDLERVKRMERRYEQRDELRRRPGVVRRGVSPELKAKVLSETARERANVLNASTSAEWKADRARKGGQIRWAGTTKRERREAARAMVQARANRREAAHAAGTSPEAVRSSPGSVRRNEAIEEG